MPLKTKFHSFSLLLNNSKVSVPFQPFYVKCLDETFPASQEELHFLSCCFCPCNDTDHVFWPSVTSSRNIILFMLHSWCLTDTWPILHTQYRFPAEVMLHCIWYRLVSADVQLDTLRKQTWCSVSIHSYWGVFVPVSCQRFGNHPIIIMMHLHHSVFGLIIYLFKCL